MKTESFIHSLYPHSPDLITANQNFAHGRIPYEKLVYQQEIDYRNILALQEAANLTYIEDGKLTWQDIFRPFVETTDGFKVGALTRWFDNNTFFKQPVITGPLTPDFNQLDAYFPKIAGKNWKITLPSPYTFARLCLDETAVKPEQTLEKITELTLATIRHLEDRGVAMIQLNEPYLPYHGADEQSLNDLLSSLKQLDRKNRRAKLAVHFFFGDGAPIIRRLESEHVVDILGADLTKTQITDLPGDMHHGLIAGLLDGRDSRVEGIFGLAHQLDAVAEQTRAQTIYLSSNCDLEFLPADIARQKVELLGRFKHV